MTSTASRDDPFMAFRFGVSFDSLPVAGFSEVSGIGVNVDYEQKKQGGQEIEQRFSGQVKYSNLILKRGIADRRILDWFWRFSLPSTSTQLLKSSTLSVFVRDPAGENIEMALQFLKVRPVSWSGPDLNAIGNNVALESLTLSHEGFVWLTT